MSVKKDKILFVLPSWLLAILTSFIALIELILIAGVLGVFDGLEKDVNEGISYIIYGLTIALFCFYICKNNPRSIWYVIILANASGIISAIFEPTFWITSLWIFITTGMILSVLAAIIGSLTGRKEQNLT